MPNYEELYLTLMRETERAVRILVEAQKTCEELYMNMEDAEVVELRLISGKQNTEP